MRQVLRAGALGRPRGMGWGGRWKGGSGCRIHVNPWLIHVNVWQKPLQYCKVISLQLVKINGKKKERKNKNNLLKKRNTMLLLVNFLFDKFWGFLREKVEEDFLGGFLQQVTFVILLLTVNQLFVKGNTFQIYLPVQLIAWNFRKQEVAKSCFCS